MCCGLPAAEVLLCQRADLLRVHITHQRDGDVPGVVVPKDKEITPIGPVHVLGIHGILKDNAVPAATAAAAAHGDGMAPGVIRNWMESPLQHQVPEAAR